MAPSFTALCSAAGNLHKGGFINAQGYPRVTVSSIEKNGGLNKVVVTVENQVGAFFQGRVPAEGLGSNVTFEPVEGVAMDAEGQENAGTVLAEPQPIQPIIPAAEVPPIPPKPLHASVPFGAVGGYYQGVLTGDGFE